MAGVARVGLGCKLRDTFCQAAAGFSGTTLSSANGQQNSTCKCIAPKNLLELLLLKNFSARPSNDLTNCITLPTSLGSSSLWASKQVTFPTRFAGGLDCWRGGQEGHTNLAFTSQSGGNLSWCNGCQKGFEGRAIYCPWPGLTECPPSQRYPAALPSLTGITATSRTSSHRYHRAFFIWFYLSGVFFFFFLTNSKYTRNQRFWKIKFFANSGWSDLIVSAGGEGGRVGGRKEREKSGRGILKKFRNTLFQHLLNKMGWVFSEIPKCFISTFSHSCLKTAFLFYRQI